MLLLTHPLFTATPSHKNCKLKNQNIPSLTDEQDDVRWLLSAAKLDEQELLQTTKVCNTRTGQQKRSRSPLPEAFGQSDVAHVYPISKLGVAYTIF